MIDTKLIRGREDLNRPWVGEPESIRTMRALCDEVDALRSALPLGIASAVESMRNEAFAETQAALTERDDAERKLAESQARVAELLAVVATLRKRTDFVLGATKNAAWERFLFEQREGFDALLARAADDGRDDSALREFGLKVGERVNAAEASSPAEIAHEVDAVLGTCWRCCSAWQSSRP